MNINIYISQSIPVSPITIAMYLSYLFNKAYSSNTMSNHLSAIAFVHKMYGHRDNTAIFFIQKLMQGARNSRPVCDVRQPITLDILIRLVDSLEHVCRLWCD